MRARPFLLLADYDGTLVPIRSAPALARLDPATRRLLRRLSQRRGVRLGLISGRSLPELRGMVRVPGALYVGNHGLELQGPGVRFIHPQARRAAPVLVRIAAMLRRVLRPIPGAWVESKRLSLSIHWRAIRRADRARFQREVRGAVSPWVASHRVRVTTGKRVVEIRPPVAWDKGAIVEWLMKRYRCPRGGVIYFGDDRTDEDAFRAVNRAGGISVFVGAPRAATAARWRVRGPRQVRNVLHRLEVRSA